MSSKLKDKCIGIKCDKPKICNPNNGNCINELSWPTIEASLYRSA